MNKFKELIKWVEEELRTAQECNWSDKSKIYANVYGEILDKLKDIEKDIMKVNPLLVEDGSVDIEQLEEDGFYVIPYRQGSRPPMWLNKENSDSN